MSGARVSRIGVIAVAVCLAFVRQAPAQDWAKVEVKSVPAGPGVFMLQGAGGNIGLAVGPAGTLLVDTEFAQLHDKIAAAIGAAGGRGAVRFVLNTNWHYDHALGNALFRKDGAVIVGHASCRLRMPSEQVHEVIGSKTPAYPPEAMPEITFADRLVLHLGDEVIEGVHVRGAHSDADAFYVFRKANVVHTGDLFFSEGYPYIDIGNGGSIDGMIAAADTLAAAIDGNTRLIPGHGALADGARLRAYRSMLAAIRDRVAAQVRAGRTVEQVVAAKPTADFDKDWAKAMPPDAFVQLVYKSLSRREGQGQAGGRRTGF